MNKHQSRRSFIRTAVGGGTALVLAPTILKSCNFMSGRKGNSGYQPFTPDYKSLQGYHCPEWFRDAKFGIFLHYGLNTVPGMNGHYGRFMYMQKQSPEYKSWAEWGKDVYAYHNYKYGHPSKFG